MFRKTILAAAALLAVPALAAPATPQERLDRALAGRVAGAPVHCLPLRPSFGSEIVPGIGVLYRQGGTVYLQRPHAGAESLRRTDVLVSRNFGERLCRSDVIQVFDQNARVFRGSLLLEDFVPYTRPRG